MTALAPFTGVLVEVQEKHVSRLCRRFHALKALGRIDSDARLVVYDGGYVALNVSRAHAETLIAACGLRSAEA